MSTKTKDIAAAERKLWRKERTALRATRRQILGEAGREIRHLQARLARLRRATAQRLAQCDKREAILNARLGA